MTEPVRVLFSFILLRPTSLVWVVWCVGPLGTAMRVRVLHAKLYAYALPGSTARQSYSSARALLDSSTARQLLDRPLDRPRQTSTPSLMESGRVRLDRLDRNSTVTRQARQARPRQRLDSASTEPRQLDSSTARAQFQRRQSTVFESEFADQLFTVESPSRF